MPLRGRAGAGRTLELRHRDARPVRCSVWLCGALHNRLKLVVAGAGSRDIGDAEPAALQQTSELQVRRWATHRVDAPVDRFQLSASGESLREDGDRRQHPFTASVDVAELQDERSLADPEPPQYLGAPGLEDQF